MADVIVTMNVMPENPEIDLDSLYEQCLVKIKNFSGMTNAKKEIVPVAFGLKALKIMFVMAEDLGATDDLEKDISGLEGIKSVEVTDVRRSIG